MLTPVWSRRLLLAFRISLIVSGLMLASGGAWNIYSNERSQDAFGHVLKPLAVIPIADLRERKRITFDVQIPDDRHWRWLTSRKNGTLKFVVGPVHDRSDRDFKRDALVVKVDRGGESLPVERVQGHMYVPVEGYGAMFRARPGDRIRIEISPAATDRILPDEVMVHPYFDFMTVKGRYAFDSLERGLGMALIACGGLMSLVTAVWWYVAGRRRAATSKPT